MKQWSPGAGRDCQKPQGRQTEKDITTPVPDLTCALCPHTLQRQYICHWHDVNKNNIIFLLDSEFSSIKRGINLTEKEESLSRLFTKRKNANSSNMERQESFIDLSSFILAPVKSVRVTLYNLHDGAQRTCHCAHQLWTRRLCNLMWWSTENLPLWTSAMDVKTV